MKPALKPPWNPYRRCAPMIMKTRSRSRFMIVVRQQQLLLFLLIMITLLLFLVWLWWSASVSVCAHAAPKIQTPLAISSLVWNRPWNHLETLTHMRSDAFWKQTSHLTTSSIEGDSSDCCCLFWFWLRFSSSYDNLFDLRPSLSVSVRSVRSRFHWQNRRWHETSLETTLKPPWNPYHKFVAIFLRTSFAPYD